MFKKFLDGLGIANNKINEIIKETNRYINAEENVSKETKDAVAALKSYAETETPSLGQAINSLANTFEIIEKERLDKVTKLRDEYIAPLNELVINLKKLQTEQSEAEKATKELEKAEKSLNKARSKPKEKLKPNEIELAESKLNAAKEKVAKEAESDTSAFLEKLSRATLKHEEILLVIKEKVSETGKPVIESALEYARRGYEQVMEALE